MDRITRQITDKLYGSVPEHIVLSDLDSTIADTSPRHHLTPHRDPASSWEAYALACSGDLPMRGPIRALQIYASLYPIHIVSLRHAAATGRTKRWLKRYDVPYDVLRLRRESEPNDSAEYKISYIREVRDQGFEPILFLEDWPDTARAIEAETGVPVLVVNPCYPPKPPETTTTRE